MKLGKDSIETWCMKVESQTGREPMDMNVTKSIITLTIQKDRIDQDPDLRDIVESKKAGILSAFWLRVKAFHTYEITMSAALFLERAFFTNFAMSTMVANYLQYMAHKHNRRTIDLEFICSEVWPHGFQSKEQWSALWEAQKVNRDDVMQYIGSESGVMLSDNLLNYVEFGESIRSINTD